MLTACRMKCELPSRSRELFAWTLLAWRENIIDHVEKSGDLIGRDKILSPAQLRVRDETRPFPL